MEKKSLLKIIFTITFIGVIIAIGKVILIYNENIKFYNNTIINTEITIDKGEPFTSIYNKLFKNIEVPPYFKEFLINIKKIHLNLKYGYYASQDLTIKKFINNIVNGIQTTIRFTVPEGFNIFDIANLVEKNNIGNKEEFIDLAFNKEFIKITTGKDYSSIEGFLFPGTYQFPKNIGAKYIIQEMYNGFLMNLPKNFNILVAKQGLTPYEAVTLASIIQKETYLKEEAPIVASVFYNRLKLKMRLQADPTIIYGNYINFDGNIKKKHLQDRSNIYNTYKHSGLPPTPIANPSIVALEAVIKPAKTDYLYFVATKDGHHLFSNNYRQHVNYVRKHQK